MKTRIIRIDPVELAQEVGQLWQQCEAQDDVNADILKVLTSMAAEIDNLKEKINGLTNNAEGGVRPPPATPTADPTA